MSHQHFRLSAILLAFAVSSFACACNNAASNDGAKKSASGSSSGSGSDSTFEGASSFSYTVDGRHVAIKDMLHNGDGLNHMALYLNKVTNNAATGIATIHITNELTSEVFKLSAANNGSTSIENYRPSLDNFAAEKTKEATYMSPKYINYYGDAVTVTITDINATHVAGTFSGKFSADRGKNQGSVNITDGKFDLQYKDDKK
jgi:hypothetical protein